MIPTCLLPWARSMNSCLCAVNSCAYMCIFILQNKKGREEEGGDHAGATDAVPFRGTAQTDSGPATSPRQKAHAHFGIAR